MIGLALLLAAFVLLVLASLVGWFFPPGLARSAYPAPDAAENEMDGLAAAHPGRVRVETIGHSREGRPIRAFRLSNGDPHGKPRLLVTAHIHAVEYVGSYVARRVARRLLSEGDAEAAALLDAAEVVVVPLLNPDGAARIWRVRGRTGLGWARFTAAGVDPNRNFPFSEVAGKPAWNSGRNRPGSAYYRGPHPLSEPECAALARLAKRDAYCAAINFHSFGCVVFLPEVLAVDGEKAQRVLDSFHGPFQSAQPHRRYKPVPERSAAIVGQLDPFLLHGLGTPSVTIEVSRPGLHLLSPRRLFHVFSIANPPEPDHWAENDAAATVHALAEMLDRSGGTPCRPAKPELADAVEG